MAIIEAVCGKCGDTFNPGDEDDTIHLVREDGTECGGQGTITGEWGGTPKKQYLSALPYDPTDRKPPRGTPQRVIDLGPVDRRYDHPGNGAGLRDHDLFNDDERDDDMNPLEPETES
jgi:hypothetical protein